MHNSIYHAMLQHKFGVYSTLGEFNVHKLLDYTRSSEADQRARLSKCDVTEHSETGCNTTCRGVGQ